MKCRKLLAILLALVMVIGLLPFAALADGSQDNQLDYIQGTDPDPVGDPGIDPGVDPDIQPDTDLNIDPDGEPDGNLVLQVPDTEPEHKNHGANGTGTITGTGEWQAWDPKKTPTISKSGYYYLDNDFKSINRKIKIDADVDVHLCLNGHEMSDSGANPGFITVNSGASLTICDCSKDKNGTINYNCTDWYAYAIVNNGALTLYSGKIYSEVGNGIDIKKNKGGSNVKFDMEGGTIDVGGTGILFFSGDEVNINDGTLTYGGETGVMFAAKGTLTVSGGTIRPRENGASESRGIARTNAGDLNVTDGNISGKQYGIQNINAGDGEVEISGGNISASGEEGYGIYLNKFATADLYLRDTPTISGQKADLYIGKPNAVYASNENGAYSGDLLNIYFSGAAAETDPIILNVTSENAALFELVRPYGKDLVRKGNNLYLADKLPPMPELTVTVDPNPLTYGQTAQATVSGAPSGVDVTYTYSIVNGDGIATINAQTGEIAATGIGTFQVKVVASADGYEYGEATSAEITVNKATPTSEAPTAKTDLVYTGAAQELVTAGTATGGTMVYSLDGENYDEAVPTGINAGTYTVWYKVNGNSGYSDTAVASFSVTIEKAPLTVTAEDKRIYEGSPDPTYTATYSGFVNGEDETDLSGKLSFTCDYKTSSQPGTYDIKPSGLTSTNYDIEFENGTLTVVAVGDIFPPAAKDLTYTGKAQKLIDPATAEDDVDLFYSLDGSHFYSTIPEAKNARTYTVYWEAKKGGTTVDYGSLQVIIKKAPLTVKANDTWVYAGDTPAFTATITGYVNGEDGSVLKGKLTFTCSYSQKYSKPGSRHTIYPEGLRADNYHIAFETGTLTVKDPLSPRFNVYVLDSKHGTVEADCRYARKGDVVTLTIKPDWGYELETLTVTDSHGYELKLTYHSNGTYTFTMPRDNVTVKAIFTVRDMPFVDVPGDAWYAGGVRYVYAHGLMNGTGSWRFSPNRTTTRAMIATILYRMEGSPRVYGTSQFGDVEAGSWYEDAVIWATQNDIVEGYTSKTFGPNDPITREQMAAMLYRYADYCRCDMSAGRYVDLSKYSDMNEISDYAIPALRWAVGEEIIQGRTGKRLAPTDTATRAEVAVMLMRFCEEVIW